MKVGIIDADLIERSKHRFPNLASEKISGYWKDKGADTELLMNYDNLDDYDHVFISKVFTDTPFPEGIEESERIHFGGTGFYFDKAKRLEPEIEYHIPDYNLYDKWINSEVLRAQQNAENTGADFDKKKFMVQFKEYTDYSIGFLTRGCFRKCKFCVNQKYSRVVRHMGLSDFVDQKRKKICLLDDNFLGLKTYWREYLEELMASGKSFKFKQGLRYMLVKI